MAQISSLSPVIRTAKGNGSEASVKSALSSSRRAPSICRVGKLVAAASFRVDIPCQPVPPRPEALMLDAGRLRHLQTHSLRGNILPLESDLVPQPIVNDQIMQGHTALTEDIVRRAAWIGIAEVVAARRQIDIVPMHVLQAQGLSTPAA